MLNILKTSLRLLVSLKELGILFLAYVKLDRKFNYRVPH